VAVSMEEMSPGALPLTPPSLSVNRDPSLLCYVAQTPDYWAPLSIATRKMRAIQLR
jgi:hypothetical protein